MNNDRVTEVYEGTHGSAALQDATRQRIHWMCEGVVGDDVLDVGCSQGIATVLLARAGRRVVGVDNEPPALEFCRRRLSSEKPAVQRRVTLVQADGTELPYPEASFDCVLLGEVLEHQVEPERLLREARRVVRPGGRVIVTTPYGRHPHPDHKQTVYIGRLLEWTAGQLQPLELELVDRWIGLVAAPARRKSDAKLLSRALEIAERRFAEIELAHAEQKERSRDVTERLHETRARERVLADRVAELSRETDRLHREVNRQTTRTAVLEDRDASWSARLERTEARVAEAERLAEEAAEERARLATLLEAVREDGRLLYREKERLEHEAAGSSERIAPLLEEVERQTARQKVLQKRDDRWRERYDDVREALDAGREETRAARDDGRRLEHELREGAAALERRQAELESLGDETHRLEGRLSERSAALERSELSERRAKDELDRLRGRAGRLEEQAARYKRRIDERDRQVERLEARLEATADRLATRAAQVTGIYESRSWRLLRRLWRIKQAVLHPRGGGSGTVERPMEETARPQLRALPGAAPAEDDPTRDRGSSAGG